ncbi:hypothetical protein NGB30_01690 [Mammaliicoccus fleurettii]|uniref:hypothetical protein n=1 Tax=Mammaliicoccus fleurettii TaxID=150056 RepID=UPI002DB72C27|nr:hypothetical protein [Mammaliicoccus fleurettii]MEB7779244.1 hypothetical protein [Mammaliicoccus fleurettii]
MAKVNYEDVWKTHKEKLLQEYVAQKQRVERVKKRLSKGYVEYKINDINYERGKLGQMTEELHLLDILDGTHEFSNLLDDMNRERE